MTVVTDGAAARSSGARASGQARAGQDSREHPAHADGVKLLGGKPAVIEFASGDTIEVAARAGHRALVTGPMAADVA